MSFILDALKKSENDRQRQSGPALFEVKVPPPRSRFPLLAVVIVSLLLVNLGVVGWLMFRSPEAADAAAAPLAASASPQPQVAQPTPAPVQQQAYSMPPPPPTGYQQMQPPPQGYPQQAGGYGPPPPQGYPQGAYGQPNGMPPGSAYPPNAGYPQQQAQQYNSNPGYFPPADPQLDETAEPGVNPDDYAPARAPSQPALSGLVRRGNESGLPSYDEAATRVSLPRLHLDLHSYAPDPSQRFVLVNMKRLYEGENTPEGVKVESITPDAAVMSYQGTRFILDRD